MTNSTLPHPMLSLSERIYRALLVFYPAEYRHEYGMLMVQVFRDMCRAAYRDRGIVGVLLWWCTTLFDLAITALEQRRKAGIQMYSIAQFLRRFSGILLIASGLVLCVASLAELQPGMNYPLRGIYQVFGFMFVPAIALISLGTIGITLNYQAKAGSVGRLGLFGAVLGVLILLAYMVITLITRREDLWNVFLFGFLLHAAGLVVFGVIALHMHPLSHWNWLPIVIGSMPFFLLVFNPSKNGSNTEWENILAYVVMGVGYAALGYIMHRGQVRTAAPALA